MTRGSLTLCGALTVLLTACGASPGALSHGKVQPQAVGAAYYVDNAAGANCSDAAAGTSPGQPWCDFTPVNARTFSPGDEVLLARGATWRQGLVLRGSGTAADPITLGAYGSGNRPVVRRDGASADTAVDLADNPSHVAVRDLEISDALYGLRALYTTLGNTGLEFSGLSIHDVGNGVTVGGDASGPRPGPGEWILRDVTVSESEVARANYAVVAFSQLSGTGDFPASSLQDLVIRGNYTHDIALVTLPIVTTTRARVFDNYFHFVGKVFEPQGTTGIYLWRDEDLTFANNVMVNLPDTGAVDQSAVDHEGYNSAVRFRGNYIAGNAGPGLEYLALAGRAGDFNTGHEVSSNLFFGNGTAGTSYRSSLYWNTDAGMTGTARDNLYSEPTGFATGTPAGWTLSNNLPSDGLYHAGFQFSPSQGTNGWSYQEFDGRRYADLSFDASTYRWGTSEQIRQFSALPGPCAGCWVPRAWTAPSTGTVAIRGRALMDDRSGGGVRLRITQNGAVVWPSGAAYASLASGDQDGLETNLSLGVAAGDEVRFEVNNGGAGSNAGDLTSWSPGLGYTTGASGGGGLPSRATLINVSSGKCLQLEENSADNGATATQWQCDQGRSKVWTLLDQGGGQYQLVNANSGKCLQVDGNAAANGTAVVQWQCDQGASKLWTLSPRGGRQYQLVNVNSGKCLQVDSNSADNGTRTVLWPCDQGQSKLWTVE